MAAIGERLGHLSFANHLLIDVDGIIVRIVFFIDINIAFMNASQL